MIPPTRQMRQVLAQLELISHGSVQSWNSDGRGGFERFAPPGELHPPHLHYRREWDKAKDDKARQHAYGDACKALREATQRDPVRPEGLPERDIMVSNVLGCAGWSALDVATHFRYTAKQVRQIRLAEERDPDSGKVYPGLAADEPRWAARLYDEGMTQARIAERMGVSQATVSRLLKFRRAA